MSTQQQQYIDFIDYFNLVEQYTRSEQQVRHHLMDDKEDDEDEEVEDVQVEEEDDDDDDDEHDELERATTQVLQQRLSTFVNTIKYRLVHRKENSPSSLFYDDVFGQLKSLQFLARQFHLSSIEQSVTQCYQIILDKYCCCGSSSNDGQDDMNAQELITMGEQLLIQYKNQNEVVHGQLLELDTACAYSFEYIRFKCCRDLLLAFSQQSIKKIMSRLKVEKERIEQNLKMCTMHPSHEKELVDRDCYSTLNSTNERYKGYTMLLADVERYMMIASDLSLDLQFSKQIPR